MSRGVKLVVGAVVLLAVLSTIRPSTAQAHWGFGHHVGRPVVSVHFGYRPLVGWHRPHYTHYGAHFRWHHPYPARVYYAPPVDLGYYSPYGCY